MLLEKFPQYVPIKCKNKACIEYINQKSGRTK